MEQYRRLHEGHVYLAAYLRHLQNEEVSVQQSTISAPGKVRQAYI